MSTPGDLKDWTYETIVFIVSNHDSEPAWFDFKAVLNPKGSGDSDHVASIRRTACSMANGDGGYILFGIKDLRVQVNSPEDRIVGIPHNSELRKELGEKLSAIQRAVYFDAKAISLPNDSAKCVLVAHVPTSELRPHMDTSTGAFYIRGQGGSAATMDFTQVRDQMLYTEGRLRKVMLLRMELATILEVANMTLNLRSANVRFDIGAYRVLVADVADMLQGDDELLKQLHDIGSNATILNPLLDKQQEWSHLNLTGPFTSEKGQLSQDINDRRGKLFNDCGRARDRLNTLFGRLDIS